MWNLAYTLHFVKIWCYLNYGYLLLSIIYTVCLSWFIRHYEFMILIICQGKLVNNKDSYSTLFYSFGNFGLQGSPLGLGPINGPSKIRSHKTFETTPYKKLYCSWLFCVFFLFFTNDKWTVKGETIKLGHAKSENNSTSWMWIFKSNDS